MKKIIAGMLMAITMMLSGCGGGGGSPNPSSASVATKGVMYPVVVGLSYQTNSGSGVVASDGSYTYKGNENVTFSAGGIELATVPAAVKVTPLPLDNDVASTNLLRLLKALDSDGNLTNGVSLASLATSTLTSVDLTSETAVVAALSSLKPSATLPLVSDTQVTTVLAGTKATALLNMGSYGSTYKAIIVDSQHATPPLPGFPKDAVVNLTSQPNWTTGTMTGTVILTLNDNSTVTLPISNANGNYTASSSTFAYKIRSVFGGKSRIIGLTIVLAQQTSNGVVIYLRDNSQPNTPPIAHATGETTFPLSVNVPHVTTLTSYAASAGGVSSGSRDNDGIVVSQAWTSSKGKTGTGISFSEGFLYNENGSITLTVTDDEGATSSKTWKIVASGSGIVAPTSNTLTLSAPYKSGGTSSFALNYLKSWDLTTPGYGGLGGTRLIDNTDIPTTNSNAYTNYVRRWVTGDGWATGDSALEIVVHSDTISGVKVLNIYGGDAVHGSVVYEFGLNGFSPSFDGGCLLNTSLALPSCSSVGINLNSGAGTISFTNTPVMKRVTTQGIVTSAVTITINGTLAFTPF